MIENLLFSSSITIKTKLIFISRDGLNDGKQLLISLRLYKHYILFSLMK